MKVGKLIVCCSGSLIFCSVGIAASQLGYNPFLHPFFRIIAGVANIPKVGKSQEFSIGSSDYQYAVKHAIATPELIGGSIGTQLTFNPSWDLQLGLAYYQLSSFAVKGTLTQGSDALTSQQYNYSYTLLVRQTLLESRILTVWRERYHPYLTIGIGEAFNRVNQYQTDAPIFLVFTPAFSDKTNKSFSYNIGLGVDIDILPHLQAGVGYRFTDFGKVNLGNSTVSVYSNPHMLKQRHLYTNEFLAQLTWIL